MNHYLKTIVDGLWKNNAAIVQALGLCPLLGVSNNFANAFGLSLATIFVLTSSNILVSTTKKFINNTAVRLPIFVLIISSFVTIVELIMQAFMIKNYNSIGIFIPLIATNCIVLSRSEVFASKNNVLQSAFDGLIYGLGFGIVLIILGSMREIIGSGTIFADLHLILNTSDLTIHIHDTSILLAILPPGAFIVLAFMVAFKNFIDISREEKAKITAQDIKDRRVRAVHA